jgi:hypothetical protein
MLWFVMGNLKKNQYRTANIFFVAFVLSFVSFLGTACHLVKKPDPISENTDRFLQSNQAISDSVGIEIFTIRITPPQQELVRQLWLDIDEQILVPPLRRELAEQGFRVGLLGNLLTPALSQLINITADADSGKPNELNEFRRVTLTDLSRETAATKQYCHLLPDMRVSLKVFDNPLPELSRFWLEGGQFCGQTYKNALGFICVEAQMQTNGTVRFEIIPELEYGTTERRIRIHSGVMFSEEGRPRLPFTSLTVTQDILPGQWIIIGTTSPNCTGMARAFFFRGTEEPEQKMLAIRLIKMNKGKPSSSTSDLPVLEKETDFTFQERN